MDYAFTDRVRKVLAIAREEALRLRHEYVGTEHQLLGLIEEGEGIGMQVLASFGIEGGRLRERVEQLVRPGTAGRRGLGDLPYTSRAKRVLEQTMKEARMLGHPHVGTEHLLLGLLREKGVAADALGGFGVTADEARRRVEQILGSSPRRLEDTPDRGSWLRRWLEPRTTAAAPSFTVTIDDSSSESIYQQIIAQVQEAVATGRLGPGQRLPPVRQLADELDIAPGTVARAYSELERLGVVVTEGARGTRVADRPAKPLEATERPETLSSLLRPVVVAAFHLGATAKELREALERAMQGIYADGEPRGS